MLKIDRSPRFLTDVTVNTGGEPETFQVRFNVLPVDAFAGHDLNSPEGLASFLKAVVSDVHDVVDEAGSPVTFSDELLDRLIAWPDTRGAMFRAYVEGLADAARGN